MMIYQEDAVYMDFKWYTDGLQTFREEKF
jgi:hypothetical protein